MPNNAGERVYAGFFVRLAAYLIDWVIVGAALLMIRIPVWIASLSGADFVLKDFIFRYSLYDIALYALKVTYFVLLTYYTGATLGKKLLHIRVISTEDRKPTFFEILFRESVGKFLSGLVLEVGYLMIGLEKNKSGLHDILSDTYVVYQHKKVVAVPTPVIYQQMPYTVPANQMPPYGQGGEGASYGGMPPQNQSQVLAQEASGGVPLQNQGQVLSHEAGGGVPLQNQNRKPVQETSGGISLQNQGQMPVQEAGGGVPLQNQGQVSVQEAGGRVPLQNQGQVSAQEASGGKPPQETSS